jgi:hypothetical protein
MLIGYICGTTVSRSKNTAPNEYGHLWEEIEQNRLSTVKEKLGILAHFRHSFHSALNLEP